MTESLNNADFAEIVNTVRASAATLKPDAPVRKAADKPAKIKRVRTKAEIEKRKEKKEVYQAYQKELKKREEELKLKYRDRATERRDGKHDEDQEKATIAALQATARAAAASVAGKYPQTAYQLAQQKKKLLIEESKYLGGDMEHTHLVKGLDYALLSKKRQEIREEEAKKEEAEMERLADKKIQLERLRQITRFESAFGK